MVPEAYCDRVCPSVTDVCECVHEWRESVSPTLWTPYLKNQLREFHQILVTDILRVVDADYILGSKVKVTAGNVPKTCVTPYLNKRSANAELARDADGVDV